MALQTAIGNVALAVGPFAAGLLLDALNDDYQPVLATIAVVNLLALLLLIALARFRRPTSDTQALS